MNQFKIFMLSVIAFSLAVSSCTSETKKSENTISADQLSGRWELTSASRNGEETGSLEGTYFDFYGEGKLNCNFTGESVDAEYTLKDNVIKLKDQSYKIENLEDKELKITTTLMNFDFAMIFTKVE